MRPETLRRSGLATLGVAIAVGLLAWTFRNAELTGVTSALSRIQPIFFPLILLPQLLALSMESLGWRELLKAMGQRLPLLSVLSVRVKTEAMSQTLPLGQLFCESAKPALLLRCGVPVSVGVASVGARKYLLILSQACFLLFAFVVGHSTLAAASEQLVGSTILQWLPLVCSIVLGGVVLVMGSAFHRGSLSVHLLRQLIRIPSERVRAALFRARRHFTKTDSTLRSFFSGRIKLRQLGPFFAAWALESAETLLILRLLGVEIGFVEVVSFEVLLTLARNIAFIVPAGIGVQDFGYVAFFGALGIADPVNTGAAFTLLKRTKELSWALIGYGLMALSQPLPKPAPATQS